MQINKTTIVLWPSEPDAHVIRLRDLTYISDFAADARSSLKGYGSLVAGAAMRAAATVSVSATGTRLNTISRLQATSALSVATQTFLPLQNMLAARPQLQVQAAGHLLTTALFRSSSQLALSVVPPKLFTGAARLRGAAGLALLTNSPRLSRVAQFFSAAATLRVATLANLIKVGPSASSVLVAFNGVQNPHIRINTIQITDELNEAPNTCTFIMNGPPPPAGATVAVALGNWTSANLIFAGTVKQIEQYWEGKPANPAWQITGEDFTWLINRRKVIGSWKNVSATQVALDILARFTSGFSSAGIAGGLPPITITFVGETVMDALTQIANAIGGYAGGPDYNRIVWLFITDPRPNPTVITPSNKLFQMTPPLRQTLDLTQVRTRVDVRGASTQVGGPPDFNIDSSFGQLPIQASKIFTPGTSGQVLTEDAQIVTYSDVAPGGLASIVRGNVPPPIAPPVAQIAAGVAGGLQGSGYQWKIAFANALGETEVGPASWAPLTANAFPSPPTAFGAYGHPSVVGPLVGTYKYAVSFVTSLGETPVGPPLTVTAAAVDPPGYGVSVGEYAAAGPLEIGATYGYRATFLTAYGETLPSNPVYLTPSTLPAASLGSFTQYDFGGLQGDADYRYAVSIVTKTGEGPAYWWSIHTFSRSGSPGSPAFTGYYDANGRMDWGQYYWACSYYSDQFGESVLGPAIYNTPSGTPPPPGTKQRIGIAIPGLSARADGIRVYRAIAGSNYQLEVDYRRGNVPSSYLSYVSQGECGNGWPNHQLRGGGISCGFYVYGSSAPGVLARRVYRSKGNGTDLFLLTEIQNNDTTWYFDTAFDDALTVRNPVVQSAGRQAIVSLPPAPWSPSSGYLGRRVYRTKANSTVFYRIADIKEMTSMSLIDNTADASLAGDGPPNPSTAGGCAISLSSIPLGPTGTLARRVYRTVAGGVELKLLVEIGDNSTQSYVDTTPDGNLGQKLAPLVNTAGAAAVQLTQIPRGNPSVTQRFVYRTKAGGGDFLYAGAISNNTDTSYLDTKKDDELGRPPVVVSTIGALAGDTSVVVQSAAGWPQSGWFEADSQIIRYSGISYGQFNLGDTLLNIPPLLPVSSITRSGQTATAVTIAGHGFKVGQRIVIIGADQAEFNGTQTVVTIPAANVFTYQLALGTQATSATGQKIVTSAPGAIVGAIAGGTTVVTEPMLIGVSGIGAPLPVGSQIDLWVVCNSAAGQSALAGLEGGDGIREYIVTDGTLDSVAACQARGNAELLQFQYIGVQIDYTTRDRLSRSGAMVTINLPAPTALSGTYRIQTVRIDQIDLAPRTYPRYAVRCSNTKYSILDLLRHVVLHSDHAA